MNTLPNREEEWTLATVSNILTFNICKTLLLKQYFTAFRFRIIQNFIMVLWKSGKGQLKCIQTPALLSMWICVRYSVGEAGPDTSPSLRTDARQAAKEYSCWANWACQSTEQHETRLRGDVLVMKSQPPPAKNYHPLQPHGDSWELWSCWFKSAVIYFLGASAFPPFAPL